MATLAPLLIMGLVEAQPVGKATRYTLHPGVAETGRTEAGDAVQAAVDTELGAFWEAAYQHGVKEEMRGGGSWIVRAGQSAPPYLLRRQQWEKVSFLLEQLLTRDQSPETVATVLPWLHHITIATEGLAQALQDGGLLARALRMAGRVSEAEAVLRDIMHKAAAQGCCRTASVMAGEIMNLLLDTGLQNLARDFAACAPDLPPLPDDFSEVCRLVEAVAGVHFQDLFERLPRRAATGNAALAAVCQGAQEIAQRLTQQSRIPALEAPREPGKQGPRRRKSGKKRAPND